MNRRRLTLRLLFAILFAEARLAAAEEGPAPFFEADQPFFQTQVEMSADSDAVAGDLVVRGVLLPAGVDTFVLFDQELLRPVAAWRAPAGQPPITLMTMAQISYAAPRRKVGADHPRPTGPLWWSSAAHPGAASTLERLRLDPRPPGKAGEHGRGPLPATQGRFDGIDTAGGTAVLCYHVEGVALREQWRAREGDAGLQVRRELRVSPRSTPLHFALGRATGSEWTRVEGSSATADPLRVDCDVPNVRFSVEAGELIATLAPSARVTDLTFSWTHSSVGPGAATVNWPSAPSTGPRWPESVSAAVNLGVLKQNGLELDLLAVPENNPWRRRVRPADLAFVGSDRAVVVTYDGDVWWVDGVGAAAPASLQWRRFASGLHEPLAVVAPHGVVQVATKNGIVRLHDRNGDGEADWYENFNDQMIQSQSTRSFPLDMALGPDGSTYVTQGGIVTTSGIKSGGAGTVHTGAVLRVAPDGRSAHAFVTGAREPFVTVHPVTGVVTGSDQQGHFTPSSVAYLFRQGDHFGFPEENPVKLTPPLVWIPHEQDSSSTSQVWMIGNRLRQWDGRLLHLSYGTGRLFLVSPDLEAPVPQAAVIPLDLKTDLPLLHARVHPDGAAVFLAGFQIWGTRTTVPWILGRLRAGDTPTVTAVAARSGTQGVVLEFAVPVDPASLRPEAVSARAWNYRRSSAYGSGRYTPDGSSGTTPWPVGQVALGKDGRTVFVHLPDVPPVMQLEVRHDFRSAVGDELRGVVYFTVHQQTPLNLADLGLQNLDLSKSVAQVTRLKEEPATVAMGKALAESLGCAACHSADGTTEGKVGPTWKGLFGTKRTFVDGTSEVADEFYLRAKILDPMKRRVTTTPAEMPSYRGVVGEQQLEALVLYIRSLRPGLATESR